MRRSLVLLAALLLVGGCGHSDPESRQIPRVTRLYSPNGEPLSGGPLGHPSCPAALSAWFARTDANHDGRLGHDEFIADTASQFDRMDLDHNGNITPAELDSFRAPYDEPLPPQMGMRVAPPGEATSGGRRRHAPTDGGPPPDDQAPYGRAMRSSGVDTAADPVMSADVGLRFQVSREDFLRQAEQIFARLDTAHDGQLTEAEVLTLCDKTPPPAGR